MTGQTSLTLVSRVDCGLCEELAQDLSRLQVPFTQVNVDEDADLLRLYNDCVPVLLHKGIELSRAPFTPAGLEKALKAVGVLS